MLAFIGVWMIFVGLNIGKNRVPTGLPEEWTQELEYELPPQLQRSLPEDEEE